MSASSRTPDDKMHRYLQRIQKLVGTRGKSPVMMKSRNKSPLSVKTPRLYNMVKYEIFFKSITKTLEMNRKKQKQNVIDLLKVSKETFIQKYQLSTPAQYKRINNSKPDQKITSAKTIQQWLNIQINKAFLSTFQIIKQKFPQQTRNSLKIIKNHRRTYSEMYSETLNNPRAKSPSTIYNYGYKTPEVVKNEIIKETKTKQTRIIVHVLQKKSAKTLLDALSSIKSFSSRLLIFELQQIRQTYESNNKKFELTNKQNSSLSRKNNQIQKQLQQSKQKLKEAIQKIKQLQNDNISKNQGQNNESMQNQTLKKLFESTKKQLEAAKKQVTILKEQNAKNVKQVLNFKKQLKAKENQCQNTKNQLESLFEQLQLMKQKYEIKLRENQKSTKMIIDASLMKQIESQKRQLEKQLKNSEKFRKQLQIKLKNLENQFEISQNQIIQMQQIIDQNNQNIRSNQKQFQKYQKQVQSKAKQIQTLRKQRLLTQKQIQFLKNEVKQKENEIQKIINQLQTKQKQLQLAQKQIQVKQKNLNEKQKQLQIQYKSLESSKKQLNQLKKRSLQKDSFKQNKNQSNVHIEIDSRDSQLSSLKQQLLNSKSQYQEMSNELLHSQRLLNQQKEKVFLLSEKQQEKQKQKLINDLQKKKQILSLQKKLATLKINQLLMTKFASRKSKFFQAYSDLSIIRLSYQSKFLFMEKVVNEAMKQRKKYFLKILFSSHLKISLDKQPEILQRSLTSQIRMKSLYSSKQSLSNASIISNNFDLFAKKINKAFQLKNSLHEIYSYGFQKIDYAALLYLGIYNPLNKQLQKNIIESFRKILFFSFSKNQKGNNDLPEDNSRFLKKGEQILFLLRKIDNKIIFTKIEAYSLLKLNSDLRKSEKIPNQSVISQKELKKELKEFIQQRNKMYQKTFQNWQRTKQMIVDYKIASSNKAY